MARRLAALLVATLALAGPAAAQDPDEEKPANDPEAPLPIRVNQAIDSGVAWLKKQTFAPGNWANQITGPIQYAKADGSYIHPTGCTSLSLYALLKSGVPKDDPVIVKGFQWIRTARGPISTIGGPEEYRIPNGTYDIACLILALEAKANPHKREAEREREQRFRLRKGEKLKGGVKLESADETWMRELVLALRKRLVRGTGWRYGISLGNGWFNGPRGDVDLSATNLSMLALLAAERCGIPQPDKLYADILAWTLTMQEKDGPERERWEPTRGAADERYAKVKDRARGFGYLGADGSDDEHVATSSMTCCGLANIVLCTTILESRGSALYTPLLQAQAEKAWWDGVAWLDENWTVYTNLHCKRGEHYYYLYCLERACDLKRIHLLAGHPWYDEGAEVLVNAQEPMGAWTKATTLQPREILNTCFALLFLNRATPAITGD